MIKHIADYFTGNENFKRRVEEIREEMMRITVEQRLSIKQLSREIGVSYPVMRAFLRDFDYQPTLRIVLHMEQFVKKYKDKGG